jgi:DNA-binding NarL/FixJ family response regulator
MDITVAIVEDDPRTRSTLESLLEISEGFVCLGCFGSGEDALEGIPGLHPQVVLMDINLPGMSGVECVRQLKSACPEIQVIMLTVYDDADRIFHALQMGASGYLLKRSSSDDILRAILEVREGGAPMSSYIARKVVQSFRTPAPAEGTGEVLTKRENEVLAHVARGCSNKEVAEALGISTETVRGYLKTIYSKLHVRGRMEAALKFMK